MFIALNADLERQFEFIYQRWLQNPRFAKLDGENDPVVGNGRSPKVLSIPGLPAGESISLSSFTTTLGGGYFFLPGLKALEFIAPNVAAHSQIVTTASAMDVARSTGGR